MNILGDPAPKNEKPALTAKQQKYVPDLVDQREYDDGPMIGHLDDIKDRDHVDSKHKLAFEEIGRASDYRNEVPPAPL